jgi:tRNA(fMet)-specific endonuclease VapC
MLALDTNTVSYYFRGDPSVVPRLQALPPSQVALPSVVLYELRYGLMRLPAVAARPRLEALSRLIAPMVVLDFDDACAQVAAALRVKLEWEGRPIGPHDTLIAATAMRHGATLVTRNVDEFSRVQGLEVLNWHATEA